MKLPFRKLMWTLVIFACVLAVVPWLISSAIRQGEDFTEERIENVEVERHSVTSTRICHQVGPQIVCENVAKPIQEIKKLKDLVAGLEWGTFAYNHIGKMRRDNPETMYFRLRLGPEPPPLPKVLEGQQVTGATPITPEISVEMRGSAGLSVEPSGPVRKQISDLSPTSWQWIVTPKIEGPNLLTMSVFIHVDDKGPYTLKTFEDEIRVYVTTWQRTKDTVAEINPVWAFGVGAVPVIWGAFVWIRNRRRGDSGMSENT